MAKTTVPNLTAGGWIRVILYVIAVLAGLASVLADPLGFGHLADLLMSASGVLLVATGGTAALNIAKADDQQGPRLRELAPAIGDLLAEVREVRTGVDNTPHRVADEVVHRIPAPAASGTADASTVDEGPVFSVYHRPRE